MGRFRRSLGREVDHLELVPQAALMAARSAPIQALSDQLPERDSSLSPLAGLDDLATPARFGVNGFASPVVRVPLTEVSDDRRFEPSSVRKVRRISSKTARIEATPKGRSFWSAPFSFRMPSHVIPCIRRHARRRAIFANGKHGGVHSRPRKTPYSDIRC